ncbi:unnamed protein product [Closterium sp. Yama58-4]|nr:unnamed protein product [Closterium sp. Yama58-4]
MRTIHNDGMDMCTIAEFLAFNKWSEVIVIHSDNRFGRNGIASLNGYLSTQQQWKVRIATRVPIKTSWSVADTAAALGAVERLDPAVFVVHAAAALCAVIFSAGALSASALCFCSLSALCFCPLRCHFSASDLRCCPLRRHLLCCQFVSQSCTLVACYTSYPAISPPCSMAAPGSSSRESELSVLRAAFLSFPSSPLPHLPPHASSPSSHLRPPQEPKSYTLAAYDATYLIAAFLPLLPSPLLPSPLLPSPLLPSPLLPSSLLPSPLLPSPLLPSPLLPSPLLPSPLLPSPLLPSPLPPSPLLPSPLPPSPLPPSPLPPSPLPSLPPPFPSLPSFPARSPSRTR